MRIYLTHCSAAKDNSLRDRGDVSPQALYRSTRIRAFTNRCIAKRVNWAIFSDQYGVWFSDERHEWYEKSPYEVTEAEFNHLLANFDKRLEPYDEIIFYVNPRRLHTLYKRLLDLTKLKGRVRFITLLGGRLALARGFIGCHGGFWAICELVYPGDFVIRG